MNGTPTSHHPLPVRISSAAADLAAISPLLSEAHAAVGDVPALLDLATAAAATAPKPGDGRTAFLWEILASVTAVDVAAGRVLEPQLDAAAIQARQVAEAVPEPWLAPGPVGSVFTRARSFDPPSPSLASSAREPGRRPLA